MEGGQKGKGKEIIKIKHEKMYCGIWNHNCTNSGIRQFMQDAESWHSCERFAVDAVWEYTWYKDKRHNTVGKRETQNSGWWVSLWISSKNPVWTLVGTEGDARADMDYWCTCFVVEGCNFFFPKSILGFLYMMSTSWTRSRSVYKESWTYRTYAILLRSYCRASYLSTGPHPYGDKIE